MAGFIAASPSRVPCMLAAASPSDVRAHTMK
jgi:hypothetical protein